MLRSPCLTTSPRPAAALGMDLVVRVSLGLRPGLPALRHFAPDASQMASARPSPECRWSAEPESPSGVGVGACHSAAAVPFLATGCRWTSARLRQGCTSTSRWTIAHRPVCSACFPRRNGSIQRVHRPRSRVLCAERSEVVETRLNQVPADSSGLTPSQ